MISNQILQNTIDGLKGITRTDLCVIDTEGKVLASTFTDSERYKDSALLFVESPADSQVMQGCQFFKVFDEHQLEYVLLAYGESDDVYMIGKIASFQIQNLLIAYKERFDKDNFIKNLLLDNLLLVDIYNRAKKLHIEADVRRAGTCRKNALLSWALVRQECLPLCFWRKWDCAPLCWNAAAT